jgi:hypothetical protein
VPLDEFRPVVSNLCKAIHNDDIGLDLTALAKYLSVIPLKPTTNIIYVPTRRTAMGPDGIGLYLMGPWAEMASCRVMKHPSVTDSDALLKILWLMITMGWRPDFFKWAGINKSTPICKYQSIYRGKIDN